MYWKAIYLGSSCKPLPFSAQWGLHYKTWKVYGPGWAFCFIRQTKLVYYPPGIHFLTYPWSALTHHIISCSQYGVYFNLHPSPQLRETIGNNHINCPFPVLHGTAISLNYLLITFQDTILFLPKTFSLALPDPARVCVFMCLLCEYVYTHVHIHAHTLVAAISSITWESIHSDHLGWGTERLDILNEHHLLICPDA